MKNVIFVVVVFAVLGEHPVGLVRTVRALWALWCAHLCCLRTSLRAAPQVLRRVLALNAALLRPDVRATARCLAVAELCVVPSPNAALGCRQHLFRSRARVRTGRL